MLKSLIFSVVFMALISCDPNVEMENISASELLSVTCVISPQNTVFTAYVFQGSSIGSTVPPDSAAVKDALVTISDGVHHDTLHLTFDVHPISGRKSYRYEGTRKNVNVATGHTYFLLVKTASGRAVDASCIIPPEAGIPVVSGEREDADYVFQISWQNSSLHKYFILILDAEGTYENTAPQGGGKPLEIHASLSEAIEFPSDAQLPDNDYSGRLSNAYIAENPVLHVTVRIIDEGLYQYYTSYERYQAWQSNNSGNLFPNFQEMPLIYSNVNGGTGIFAGVNNSETRVVP